MNCEDFRLAVGAEPSTTRLEVLEHAASCAECARYRAEMRAMDGLILNALKIDVDAESVRIKPQQRTFGHWRLAASILLGFIVFSLGWLAYPRQSLAEELVVHVLHEKESLDPAASAPADRQEIREVLRRAGLTLDAAELTVSYVMACDFRGHETPHLVVQTAEGPVTVLVLTHESAIDKPKRFDEQGFVGTLMPAPRGVVAILGRDVPVDAVSAQLMRALRYEVH